jgi:thiol-disulfide isomerase/thioredoxin
VFVQLLCLQARRCPTRPCDSQRDILRAWLARRAVTRFAPAPWPPQDLAEVLEEAGSRLVLVDFMADWCAPCKKISPVLEKLATKYRPKPGDASSGVIFCKVDVDKSPGLAQERSTSPLGPHPPLAARLLRQCLRRLQAAVATAKPPL